MLDLDIGMKDWLCRSAGKWDDTRKYDRGKVMTAEMLDAGKEFGRYLDVDGDGIPYRTYPGTHPTKGAYFTRGTSRDRYARYTEEGAPYTDNMQRLLRKLETVKDLVPRAADRQCEQADALRRDLLSARPPRRWTRRNLTLKAAGKHLDLPARARLPVPPHGRRLHRRPRPRVRGRAEPRRAAALAGRQRVRHRSGASGADPAL